MAIIFCDGFDTYATILDKWDLSTITGNGSNTPVIIVGSGRGGAGAFQSVAGDSVSRVCSSFIRKNTGTQTTMFVGFALNWVGSTVAEGAQSGDSMLISFNDGTTTQVALWIKPSGVLYFTRGGTAGTNVLGLTSSAYPSSSYHYIEVKVTIDGSAGVAELKVDQTILLNLTSQNTKVSTNASFDSIFLGNNSGTTGIQSGYTGLFDDVYFDTAVFQGDVRVNGQLPTGNGSTQNFSPIEATWLANNVTNLQTTIFDGTNLQRATAITSDFKTGGSTPTWNVTVGGTTTDNHVTWTNLGPVSHYKLVNESDPDGDSSYVQSNNAGDIERFTFPAIAGANIATVVIWAFARKDDGGFRTIQGSIKSGATVGTTGTDVSPGTNYAYLMLQALTDPNTGAAWTLAAANAAEFGVKITN